MTNWPHAPPHLLQEKGVYIVTCGTYLKIRHFNTPERLSLLHEGLLASAKAAGWDLHAWAVLSNHYHFIASSPENPDNLSVWIAGLHQMISSAINKMDNTPNRKVWYQFRDTRITAQPSYLARLNYVHNNPVKHGIVPKASLYPWCSAGQFEVNARPAFVKSVYSFDYNRVKVDDDF